MKGYPRRRKPGCLPRESKVGAICPLFTSKIATIDRSRWAGLAGKISLRPYVKGVFDQGRVSSCAAEASVQAMAISREFAGLPFISFNPLFVYHRSSGGRDRGSSIDTNLAILRDKGCCPSEVWERSKGWQNPPSNLAQQAAKKFRILEFYDVTDVDQMVTALLLGFPVVYGSNGHAVVKIAHVSSDKGLDVNSWGTNWGDDGFGVWSSYRNVGWNYGAFAVRTVSMGDG